MKINIPARLLPGFYAVIVIILFIDVAVYLSMRSIWFFVNKEIVGLSGVNLPWAILLLILLSVSFIYSFILFKECLREQNGSFMYVKIINIVLPAILILIFSALDYFVYIQLKSEWNIVPRSLIAALPWFLLILAILFFIVFYPDLRIAQSKVFKYITAAVCILTVLLYITDSGAVKIISGPVIQFIDDSKLSVVWTTNKNSTGYVEYGPDEKSLKREVAAHHGIIDANTTVHKVIIPVNTQSEFIYRVGSTKIKNYYQNSVEYGNTVVSSFRKYIDYRLNEKITFYVLNDIHENVNLYEKFLARDDYDFVVLNGDMVNSIDSQKVIENKILKPMSIYTNGTRPFYLVRGNHETRGASLRDLPDYISLPQDNFFYTFCAGPIYAIVLDSAEDKPDSHEEYAGLADFEKYLGTETKWLQTLSQSEEYKNAKYRIAFIHIPLNDFNDLEETSYLKVYQQKWRELLNDMKIDAAFSGHAHSSQLIKADNAAFDFETFIGGGDSQEEKSFVAIKVEVSEESMKVYYLDTGGALVSEYEVTSSSQ